MKLNSFLIFSSLAWAGVALLSAAEPKGTEVVARVGDSQITVADLRPILDGLEVRERAALQGDPAALNQIVRSLIVQQLLYKKATSDGYDKRPNVQQRLEQARQAAIAEGFLQASTRVPESFPTEEEVKAFYEENKARLMLPRQLRLGQIFLASPEGLTEVQAIQIERKAADLRRRLDEPKVDFAELAKAESEEPQSAGRGGEIGLLPENLIQPEVLAAVQNLPVGGLTDPVRLPGGWHIVKVLEIQEPRQASLDEIRPQLVERLRAQREMINREEFLNRLLQENPVAINELVLSDLVAPAPKKAP
jgi:parvulin-like peptidyl-prolyl isomerase